MGILSQVCTFVTSEKRIVGGDEAVPGQYSFAVSLQAPGQSLFGWSAGRSHYCGGSLISRDVVLTAAHCGPAQSSHRAVIGRHDLDTNGGQSIGLSSAIPHPSYDSRTNNNDMMLLFLQQPADQDVDIVKLNSDASAPSSGTSATVVGWGTTRQGGSASDVLREVEKKTMPNSQCAASSGSVGGRYASYRGAITSGMLCAADRGEDSCQGDSGGPLVTNRGNNRYEQVGVVSWGYGCALPDFPGVYARTSLYYEWIREQVCSRSSYPSDDFECDSPEAEPDTEVKDVEDVESESNGNTECKDMGWVDKWGDDCRWYEANDQPGCPGYGNYGGDMGLAKDGCCHCRGSSGDTPAVNPAPSPGQPAPSPGQPSADSAGFSDFLCSVFSFWC